MLALVVALDVHDRRTQGQCQRVRALADLIAEQMRLLPADRQKLRWAALLHDDGMLSVPTSVLAARGALEARERDQIREHSDGGAQLTSAMHTWLDGWAHAIANHHQRYDGSGYPRGLIGPQISLGGRILAVADAFEAMTAGRSYRGLSARPKRRARSPDAREGQFDPAVVRAMLSVSTPRLGWAMGPVAWLCSGVARGCHVGRRSGRPADRRGGGDSVQPHDPSGDR